MNIDEEFEMQHRGKSGQEIRQVGQDSDDSAELERRVEPNDTETSKVPSRQLDVSRQNNERGRC